MTGIHFRRPINDRINTKNCQKRLCELAFVRSFVNSPHGAVGMPVKLDAAFQHDFLARPTAYLPRANRTTCQKQSVAFTLLCSYGKHPWHSASNFEPPMQQHPRFKDARPASKDRIIINISRCYATDVWYRTQEAEDSTDKLVLPFCHITWRHVPQDSIFFIHQPSLGLQAREVIFRLQFPDD